MMDAWLGAIALGGMAIQLPAMGLVLGRIMKGAKRDRPLQPLPSQASMAGKVSVVVPTLNEAQRIDPCLQGLAAQGQEVREILVVDSYSTDGTPEKVQAMADRDRRFQVLNDDPLPADWVGRPWALEHGFRHSDPESEWIVGIDADTVPAPGLIASLITMAETKGYDLISLAPRFILLKPGEWWLQPALLMTLLYRFEVAGAAQNQADRVMANGQCFFCRRSVLMAVEGYRSAARSFCDDVTLARTIARGGYKVGFLDGSQVLQVRMYDGIAETWREWGRSLDLKDATTPQQLAGDLWQLAAVQGLPLLVVLLVGSLIALGHDSPSLCLWGAINGGWLAIRWAMLWAIAGAYVWHRGDGRGQWLYFLSPLADPLAFYRLWRSARHQPQSWRGRVYSIG